MKPPAVRPVRCAIYTRVSTEHGLDQEFNSLDAQYDAASAYIKNQAHAGWTLIRSRYDDGGYSGGSTDRPDLQRLMDDIRSRKIDVIVVYKVDRLTRSLAVAKLVELFDAHGVSFVSVTQQSRSGSCGAMRNTRCYAEALSYRFVALGDPDLLGVAGLALAIERRWLGMRAHAGHLHRYRSQQLRGLLERAGFAKRASIPKRAAPTSLFNSATSVWHLHDWVWHDRNPGEDTYRSEKYRTYRDQLIDACPELGLLRDVADASKHKGLGRETKIQATEQRMEGIFTGLLALTREAPRFYIVVDETKLDAHTVLLKAVEHWRTVELKDRNLPSP
jgi:Resolvase, N terminal domain